MNTETTRVEAFSDGVFAIAITLLILEIKVPSPSGGALGAQLLKQWSSYVSFVMSFAFIGIMWMNHHRLFTHIERCDDLLLIINLLLLLGVTSVPFPTAVLAVHLGRPDQRIAATLFNATYFFIAVSSMLFGDTPPRRSAVCWRWMSTWLPSRESPVSMRSGRCCTSLASRWVG